MTDRKDPTPTSRAVDPYLSGMTSRPPDPRREDFVSLDAGSLIPVQASLRCLRDYGTEQDQEMGLLAALGGHRSGNGRGYRAAVRAGGRVREHYQPDDRPEPDPRRIHVGLGSPLNEEIPYDKDGNKLAYRQETEV